MESLNKTGDEHLIHLLPSFYVWDPWNQYNLDLRCSFCTSSFYKTPLCRTRDVMHVNGEFILLYAIYRCNNDNCGKTVRSIDPLFLKSLAKNISDNMKIVFFKRSAISYETY